LFYFFLGFRPLHPLIPNSTTRARIDACEVLIQD
jgi:hypothetical protein